MATDIKKEHGVNSWDKMNYTIVWKSMISLAKSKEIKVHTIN